MCEPQSDPADFTRAVRDGDAEALHRVLPLVYDEMRRLASRYLVQERDDHTLQATALVHEAYLNLLGQREMRWQSRSHFLAVAAIAMRRLLMNHARDRNAVKRGGGAVRIEWDESIALFEERSGSLVDLDAALVTLAEIDARGARIVEMRFFGGLTNAEVAGVLDLSERTVEREWRSARAWLRRQLRETP